MMCAHGREPRLRGRMGIPGSMASRRGLEVRGALWCKVSRGRKWAPHADGEEYDRWNAGDGGFIYPSVRHVAYPAGAAVAAFWPDVAGLPVPGRHLCYSLGRPSGGCMVGVRRSRLAPSVIGRDRSSSSGRGDQSPRLPGHLVAQPEVAASNPAIPVAGDTVVATAASGTVGAVVANSARAPAPFHLTVCLACAMMAAGGTDANDA